MVHDRVPRAQTFQRILEYIASKRHCRRKAMPRVVHFEIPAANPARAAEFYRKVFGWEVNKWDGPMDYWLAVTGKKGEPGIDGAIMDRTISKATVNTIEVSSLEEYVQKITKAGGRQSTPKTEITGIGHFCYCEDTEGNLFGILEPLPGGMQGS
jgi:predicted enzyme related to lactoylglutathione lyase